METRVVRLTEVKIGATENHLCFVGYVPYLDANKKWKFDFTGVDLYATASLTEKGVENLLKELCDDFGYAPYDIHKAKRILGDGKDYSIEVW